MNTKMIMMILLFGILFFVINLVPVEASSWADPGCAPPGCNRPEPITVEGGTITTGHSLTIQGDGSNTFNTVIGGTSGFVIGSKINVDPNAKYASQNIFQLDDSCILGKDNLDNCFSSYNAEVTYFEKPIYASRGIAIEAGQVLSFPKNAGIYIDGGLEGPYGFGVYAKAADLNHSSLTGYNSNETTVKNSAGIWGISTNKNDNSGPFASDSCTITVGREFNTTDTCAYSYGGFFQGFTSRGIALHTRGQYGGYGAYLRGTILVAENFVTSSNVYHDVVPYRINSSGSYPEFIIKTANTFWNDPGFNSTPTPYEEYEILKVDSADPKKLQIGGSSTDYEICLNNDCISSWSSGGGGKSFKFVDVPSGNNPQADSSADTLQFLNGENISITGSNDDKVTFSVNRTLNYLERINAKNGQQLIIDPDNNEGLLIYDKVYIDDLSSSCNVKTYSSGMLYCGADNVNDADHDSGNELQTIDGVLTQGSTTAQTITVGELCIGNTCITEKQLLQLLGLLQ